ncbi:hypothetical protein Ais01nite_48260 [Asanoa ishikariensis]|uniref:DUF624 domain-containing protein n=1 Tax=Asanoa ishikariensis TaxID=137265 RepID=A0A1H3RUT7_9ACTN|nr:hypothetical protein [Asanoa ishikariensis]GIF66791.1 hypothetical protein Ais01nite_48260 [Asanoa ishikariensis]SDZ29476.1 hypothetical protein SAMN05421684_4253 [Asanoa ishikariensis]
MKPDWRDTVRVATDVAVLGLLMVATSLPVLTTGAAFATASFAVHEFLTHDRWPGPRTCWRVFRRTLLPGALATAAVLAAAWLVTVDLAAVSNGRVPGGAVVVGLTAVIAAAACGYAALALVALGGGLAATVAVSTPNALTAPPANTGNDGSAEAPFGTAASAAAWRSAAKAAAGAGPGMVAASAGVIGLAGLLALLVHPILAACLVGYALYALHVVTRRLSPTPATQPTP